MSAPGAHSSKYGILEPIRTSTMDFFAKIVNGLKPLTIFTKKVSEQMFDWVVNMPLNFYVVIATRIISPKAILVQFKLVLNILTRQSVHSD